MLLKLVQMSIKVAVSDDAPPVDINKLKEELKGVVEISLEAKLEERGVTKAYKIEFED